MPVIEKTGNAKSRVVAIRELQRCVELIGLPGIGKKGIVNSAKILSDEHLSETKMSLLDLIEVIVIKMNGEVQKYIKFCGATNLSEKARELVLERMSKHGVNKSGLLDTRRQSTALHTNRLSVAFPSDIQAHQSSREKSALELIPPFNLKLGGEQYDYKATVEGTPASVEEGPFMFSYRPKFGSNSLVTDAKNSSVAEKSPQARFDAIAALRGFEKISVPTDRIDGTSIQHEESAPLATTSTAAGAAASLRERLKLIRDKHRLVSQLPSAADPSTIDSDPRSTPLNRILLNLDSLLSQHVPLSENDQTFSAALEGLREIHACLTAGSSHNTSMDLSDLKLLRKEAELCMPMCVERLARCV